MYFVISPNGYSGYGKTLADSIKDLTEQDERHDIKDLEFYKGQKINVELREVTTPVEVPKTTLTKTKK
jgi:hypothetical protein